MPAKTNPIANALTQFWSNLLPPQPVLVAVSGGPDSLALLHGLLAYAAEQPALQIQVAHFNHQIRGESAQADAEFVQAFCQQAGIVCHVGQGDVPALAQQRGWSMEEAARRARYSFLAQAASQLNINLILVAHNADDQAETVLLRLLRGTGPTGLAGMTMLAPLPPTDLPELFTPARTALQIGRPLLGVWRHEIETYCTEQGLNPRHDETNAHLDYRRNQLRHELLPQLEADYQPQLRLHLTRLAELVQAEQVWLDQLVAAEFAQHARCQAQPYRAVSFDPIWFSQQPLALQRRLVRKSADWVKDLHNFEASHVAAVLQLFAGGESGQISLPAGLLAFQLYGRIGLRLPADKAWTWQQAPLRFSLPGEVISPDGQWQLTAQLLARAELKDLKLASKYEAYLDASKITPDLQLQLRPRQPGERFRPLGVPGRRKVQDVMLEAGLPRELRDSWPLLVLPAFESKSEQIVWIPGAAVSDDFKVEASTGLIYHLQFTILTSD